MSVICINQVALDFNDGRSDKVYIIQVIETEITSGAAPEYTTIGYYGRRGSTLSIAEKYRGPSKASAQAASDRLEKEKRTSAKSPYSTLTVAPGASISGMPSMAPVFGGASTGTAGAPPVAPRRAVTGPLPMLATPAADDASVERMLSSDAYCMQRKYDGERMTVSLRRSGITSFNRKGESRPLTAKAEGELKELLALPDFGDERESILDGEIMGDVFVAYDVLTLRDNDLRKQTFDERFAGQEELLQSNLGLLAPTAWTEAEKRAMLATAQAEDWEGVIFRLVDGTYVTGRTSVLLKHKLWATCTCRVLTVNAKRSVQLAMRDATGAEVFVGNVTVAVNQDIPEPDTLVEVRYLYAHASGSLFQPTLLHTRDDIDEADLRSDLRPAPPEKRGVVAPAEIAETV